MAIEKRTFIGGMDKDKDTRLVKNGDYEDALNIRVATSSDGTIGSLENIEGNQEVPMTFFDETTPLFQLNGGVYEEVNPTTVFYQQVIIISGSEVEGQNYSFNLYSNNGTGNVGVSNFSWTGLDRKTATAEYLYSQFGDRGPFSNNIVVYDPNTGSQYTASVISLSFFPSSSLSGGFFSIVIQCDTAGIPFTLDANSTASVDYEDIYIQDTGIPEIPISSDDSLSLDISNQFDTGGIVNTDTTDDGVNVGVSPPTPSDNQVLYEFTIFGIQPTSPEDPLNNVGLFSYNEGNAASESPPVVNALFQFDESLFNSGDPYELSSAQTEIAEFLVAKLSESKTLISSDPVSFQFSLAPSNFYLEFGIGTSLNDGQLKLSILGPSGIAFKLALGTSQQNVLDLISSDDSELPSSLSLFNGVESKLVPKKALDSSSAQFAVNLGDLTQDLNEALTDLQDLENEKNQLADANLNLQADLADAIAEAEDTQVALDAATLELQNALEEKDDAEAALGEALTDISTLSNQVADINALEDQLDTANFNLDSLNGTFNLLETEHQVTETELEAANEIINQINSLYTELEVNHSNIVSTIEETIANQEDGVSQADVDAVQADLDEKQEELDALSDTIEDIQTAIDDATTVGDLVTSLLNMENLLEDMDKFQGDLEVINTDPANILLVGAGVVSSNLQNIEEIHDDLIDLASITPPQGTDIYNNNFDTADTNLTLLSGASYQSSESAYLLGNPNGSNIQQCSRISFGPSALNSIDNLVDGDVIQINFTYNVVNGFDEDSSLQSLSDNKLTLYRVGEDIVDLDIDSVSGNISHSYTYDSTSIFQSSFIIAYRNFGDEDTVNDIYINDLHIYIKDPALDLALDECLSAKTGAEQLLEDLENEISSANPDLSILYPDEDENVETAFTRLAKYSTSVADLSEIITNSLINNYNTISSAVNTSPEDLATAQAENSADIANLEALIEAQEALITELNFQISESTAINSILESGVGVFKSVVSTWGPEPSQNLPFNALSLPLNNSNLLSLTNYTFKVVPRYDTLSGFECDEASALTILTEEDITALFTEAYSDINNVAARILNNITGLISTSDGGYLWEWNILNADGTDSGLGMQSATVYLLNINSGITELTLNTPSYQAASMFAVGGLIDYFNSFGLGLTDVEELNNVGGLHILISYNPALDNNEGLYTNQNGDFREFSILANAGPAITTIIAQNVTLGYGDDRPQIKGSVTTIQTP